jgi:hypothetical protein
MPRQVGQTRLNRPPRSSPATIKGGDDRLPRSTDPGGPSNRPGPGADAADPGINPNADNPLHGHPEDTFPDDGPSSPPRAR